MKLGAILLTLALALCAAEIRGWLPMLARRIVEIGSHLLPRRLRGRYREEWLEQVETYASTDRRLAALAWSVGVVVAASRLAKAARRQDRERGAALTRRMWIKRGMDLAIASAVGILVLPLMLFIALVTKLSSPGPVLWRQLRVGLEGRPFTIYKFRTLAMVRGLSPSDHEKEARVTSVGKVLRALSLDELPILLNVLRGDMSLVGPHLLTVEQSHAAPKESTFEHRTRPGLTGWWQLSRQSDFSPEDVRRMDAFYEENWSPALDIYVLLKTIVETWRGKTPRS